ncbi:MAG: chromosome segregation ATPase, partial [Verrucomicrobiales bacterium]
SKQINLRTQESERLRDEVLSSDEKNQTLLAEQAKIEQAIANMVAQREEIALLEAKIGTNHELLESGQNKKVELAKSIELALAERKETHSELARLNSEKDQLANAVAAMAEQKQALDAAREELLQVERRAASLEQRLKEVEHAESKLRKAQAEFGDLSLKNQQGREEHEALKLGLATTRKDLAQIAPEAKRLNDTRQELESLSANLEKDRAEIEEKEIQIAKMDERCAFLKEQTNDLEVREQRFRAISKEHQKLESQVGELRDFQAKHTRVERALEEAQLAKDESDKAAKLAKDESNEAAKHLQTELKILRNRKKTLTKAVDTEWGTVHLFAKGVIKRLDLVEDMIERYEAEDIGGDVTGQLKILRSSLQDALMEHSVEAYTYKPGTEISVGDRKRIKIIEVDRTAPATPGKTNILKTLRVGYVCHNAEGSPKTILRKSDVITNEG